MGTATTRLACGVIACASIATLAGGSPALATFPGANGKLTFVREGEIFVIDPAGGAETQLTRDSRGGGSREPAWSPDGRRIAFSSGRPANPPETYTEIFVMNADGASRTQLTHAGPITPSHGNPVWSPDGRQIAYGLGVVRVGSGLLVVNADGGSGGGPGSFAYGGYNDHPAWAPDSRRLAYASTPAPPYQPLRYDIWVWDDAGTKTPLTNSGADNLEPAWSPDGGTIAFVSRLDGDHEVFSMNADGTDQTQLTRNAASDRMPRWSPDGHRLAWVSDVDGDHEIYVMNADGTGQTQLTHNAAADGSVVWSPDSRRIALVSDVDGDPEIFVMNADGSGRAQVTHSATADERPDWGVAPPLEPPGSSGTPRPGRQRDTVGPAMRISRRTVRASRGGVVAVRLACPGDEPAGCSGRLTLRTAGRVSVTQRRRRRVTLGSTAFRIPAGRTAPVRVRLSRPHRRLLRRLGRMPTAASLRAVDHAGNTSATMTTIVLAAPARPRRQAVTSLP